MINVKSRKPIRFGPFKNGANILTASYFISSQLRNMNKWHDIQTCECIEASKYPFYFLLFVKCCTQTKLIQKTLSSMI